ncbi:MAG: DksA/TraR family C4-type zinc finger protein [Granulosicoccaceae bacterium]
MAGGWSRDGAVQEQIDASVDDAVKRIRENMPKGASAECCKECDKPIPQARREAVPGVKFCIKCQSDRDIDNAKSELFNRRGSKDSQLR